MFRLSVRRITRATGKNADRAVLAFTDSALMIAQVFPRQSRCNFRLRQGCDTNQLSVHKSGDKEITSQLRECGNISQAFSTDRIVGIHPTDLSGDLVHAFVEQLESLGESLLLVMDAIPPSESSSSA